MSLIRSKFAECVAAVLNLLPGFVRQLVQLPPQFYLPNRVILKTLKSNWDEEFANEKAMYMRLKSLQGHIIPRFLGDAEFNNSPSIVLSYIDGMPSYRQCPTPLPAEEFERQIEAILWSLTRFGVIYDDPKLDNFLVVNGKVIVVDLESVCEEDEQDYELAVRSHRNHIMSQYRNYLRNLSDPDTWD